MNKQDIELAIQRKNKDLKEWEDKLSKDPNDPIVKRNFSEWMKIYNRDMRILEQKLSEAA